MDIEIDGLTAIFNFVVLQFMQHNPKRLSQAAGDYPSGRTRNRSRAQNFNAPDMSCQPQAQKPGTSTGVSLPRPAQAKIPIPTSVQVPIQAQGTFAMFVERPTRRVLAGPTTTVASAYSVVLLIPVSANEKSSPRDKGRNKVLYVADNTIRVVCPAGSPSLNR